MKKQENESKKIELSNRKIKYRPISKTQVLDYGKLESEIFKYGSDVLSYSIPDRDYEIEIIVPITSVQLGKQLSFRKL